MGLTVQKSSPFAPVEDYLKRIGVRVLEAFLSKDVLQPEDFHRVKIKSILVMRQHDQLGDFLLATPVLRALREHFPDARIGVAVREYYKDVAQAVSYVDETLVVPDTLRGWSLRKARSLWHQLKNQWDAAIVLNTVSHSLTSDLLAHVSHARFVLGSSDKVFAGCSRNFLYNLLAPRDPSTKHQTEMNLDIVRYIGVHTVDQTECIVVSDEMRHDAREYLIANGIDQEKRTVGLHIGAGKPINRWPAERFGELAAALHDRYHANVIVFWGPKEGRMLAEFRQTVHIPVVEIEPSSLIRLAAFFSVCDVVVCNDTGVLHVAAATGTSVVALFGPTDPAEWMPAGNQHSFVCGNNARIDAISVEQVLDAVEKNVRKSNEARRLSV
jgi:heptosyltransferase-2